MPVRSPDITSVDQPMGSPKSLTEREETNENVSKEKMTNMKLMMKTFVLGALREKEQGNTSRYNELVEILSRDPSSPEAPSTLKLFTWIVVLSQCVSLLDKSCATLVEAALQVDWSFRNRAFVNAYIDFLENLVSAHAFYVVPILNTVVQGFRYRVRVPEGSNVTRSKSYERSHEALQCILQLIPTGTNSLFVSLVRFMPHKRFNTAEQAAYIKNILYVSEYVPVLRKQILGIVIDQMVQIDAQIQIELDEMDQDIEADVYDMNFDKDYESENSDDDMSDEDDDDDSSVDSRTSNHGVDRKDSIIQIKHMVRKLDAMMHLAFQYFSKCASSASVDVQNEIFYALVDIFDRAVLKTLKSRYTQFLLFYFCSLNVNVYSDYFLEHLIQHITDPLKPNVTRVAAAAYISSYVARAKFLDPSTIQRVVLTLSAWCGSYVDQYEPNVRSLDCTKHDVFYAVIQATMYIFCFRWRDLVINNELQLEEELFEEEIMDEEHRELTHPESGFGHAATRTWCVGLRNLPRLVMSKFNPLKLCAPSVVTQFAKLSRNTHFMYVYPVLEKNRDIFVPGLGGSNLLQTVQTFFPFDPYKLDGSRVFVDDIYFDWIAEDDEEEDSEEEEEDSEDEDVTSGMMAMSISPSPTHYLN
ncbi:RNA polymerase I-specific transcription initiation factor RRN3 [Mucor mucedo]|uniref:RNA polymerase I-specific transcription initiation factor RRN3 n=1 Tax=Mucor mucedo TaxID=29922 RepID=UPI0022200BD8|nr:RNA polymerase I-specific transcription initiation factor RRN3 [Mucor mucedo]KAI7888754.1 RNA polymerase I-specific transcription initiation factor RRN3 [Mucor mucedo]